MKKIALYSISLVLLSSCGEAYETLRTPFERASNQIGEIGSTLVGRGTNQNVRPAVIMQENQKVDDSVEAFEVSIKAPSGSVKSTAINLFHKEAEKVCGGKNYKHKITHQGTTADVEYLRNTSTTTMVPTVKGIVVCGDAA